MARAQKWDFEGRVYRPYEIPADWFSCDILFQ